MTTYIDTVNPPVKWYPDVFTPQPGENGIKRTRKGMGGVHKNMAGKARADLNITGGKKSWPSLEIRFLTQAQADALETDLHSGSVLYMTLANRPSTVFTVILDVPMETETEEVTLGDGSTAVHMKINQLREQ